MADEGFATLRAPVKRVTIPHVPVPFAVSLEDYVTPTAERIAETARKLLG
jgi:pyruvate dehydrogenase E1 component beta subunit